MFLGHTTESPVFKWLLFATPETTKHTEILSHNHKYNSFKEQKENKWLGLAAETSIMWQELNIEDFNEPLTKKNDYKKLLLKHVIGNTRKVYYYWP